MDYTLFNWSYLKPPSSVMEINHSGKIILHISLNIKKEFYIKHGEGKKSVRKIFCNVEHTYDHFEKKKIQEMKEAIEKTQLVLLEE